MLPFCLTEYQKRGIMKVAEFKESEHPRDRDGKFTDKNRKAKLKRMFGLLKQIKMQQSGAVSGAESGALDGNSEEAKEHAKRYYAYLRTTNSDVYAIAKNTGYSKRDIDKIKKYLFIDKHFLTTGYEEFYPDYHISVSWQRLAEGKNIKPMDIVMLKHEIEEMQYVDMGYSQQEAHKLANKKYNYQELVNKEERNGNNKKH